MLAKRLLNMALLLMLAATFTVLGRMAPVAGQDAASPTVEDAAAKIENAMSAAPSSVAGVATILDNESTPRGNSSSCAREATAGSVSPTSPARRATIPPAMTRPGWIGITHSSPARTRMSRSRDWPTCCRAAAMPATPIPSPPSPPRARTG